MEFKPIIGYFQPWGVLAFALRKKSKKNLLEKAELCVHMGYQDRHQVGYRLLALQTNEFIITNNKSFQLGFAVNTYRAAFLRFRHFLSSIKVQLCLDILYFSIKCVQGKNFFAW